MGPHSWHPKNKALRIYFVDNLFIFTRPGSRSKEIKINNIKKVTATDGNIARPAAWQVLIPLPPWQNKNIFAKGFFPNIRKCILPIEFVSGETAENGEGKNDKNCISAGG